MLATGLPMAPRRETHAAGAASRKAGARLRGSRGGLGPCPAWKTHHTARLWALDSETLH